VFAREFHNAVFNAAVLEYLDIHGHTELAAGVRDGELVSYYIAIEAIARTEDLTDLVAKMEAPVTSENTFEEAARVLGGKEHVQLEWKLLLKKAPRQVNRDKPLVCMKCGAGYQPEQVLWGDGSKTWSDRCRVCDASSSIVSHASWEKQIADEQQILQQQLDAELQRRLRGQKRRDKLDRLNMEWFGRVKEQRKAQRKQRKQEELFRRVQAKQYAEDLHQQHIEQALWDGMIRAQEEYWEAIALEYDPWSELDVETIALIESGAIPRQLTDKEIAKLKREAAAQAKHKLAEGVAKAEHDAEMRELWERLEVIDGLQYELNEQKDLMRQVQDRLSDLK
jgi:hypothetical protein